jgi:FkbM family methyltransferase
MESHYHINDLIFFVRQRSSDIPILKEVITDDTYEITKVLKPHDIVVDIGGHIGSFSIFASSFGTSVITYEPVTENFNLLKKNVEINGYNVDINHLAVTDKEEEREIYIRPFNYGGSNLYQIHNDPDWKEMITCTTLEKIYEEKHLDHIDFLKLDCEGAEYDILNAFSKRESIKRIALEFHGPARREQIKTLLSTTHKIVGGIYNDIFGTLIFQKI